MLPMRPILQASTAMSPVNRCSCSLNLSGGCGAMDLNSAVFCAVSEVITEIQWQPVYASVSISACTPAAPDGSCPESARTTGFTFMDYKGL